MQMPDKQSVGICSSERKDCDLLGYLISTDISPCLSGFFKVMFLPVMQYCTLIPLRKILVMQGSKLFQSKGLIVNWKGLNFDVPLTFEVKELSTVLHCIGYFDSEI